MSSGIQGDPVVEMRSRRKRSELGACQWRFHYVCKASLMNECTALSLVLCESNKVHVRIASRGYARSDSKGMT